MVSITTIDNPYDPIDEFDSWYKFDIDKGYGTSALLARTSNLSDALSETENDEELERAIDEIIKYDFMNLYKKIKK